MWDIFGNVSIKKKKKDFFLTTVGASKGIKLGLSGKKSHTWEAATRAG